MPVEESNECPFYKCKERRDEESAAAKAVATETSDLANQDRKQGPSFKDQVQGNAEESPLTTSSRQNQITFRAAEQVVENNVRNEQTQEDHAQSEQIECKRMNRLHQTAVRVSPGNPGIHMPSVPGPIAASSQNLLVAQPVEERVVIAETLVEDPTDLSRGNKIVFCRVCSIFVMIAGIIVGVLVPILTSRNLQNNGNTPIDSQKTTSADRQTSALLTTNAELRYAVDDYLHSNFFAKKVYGSQIGAWNVSLITDFTSVFENMTDFNESIVAWDVSQATTMSRMFLNASSFSGDISTWNVGKVTDFSYMFSRAKSFSGDLSTWNISSATNLANMFQGASEFSQNLCDWGNNLPSETLVSEMFFGTRCFVELDPRLYLNVPGPFCDPCSSTIPFQDNIELRKAVEDYLGLNHFASILYGHPIGDWNVSLLTNFTAIFRDTLYFNESLKSWDVSSATSLREMFRNSWSFSQDISTWNVSQVKDMSGMFFYASNFLSDLSTWNVSQVTDMSWMFHVAESFSSNMSTWDVSKVTYMSGMFTEATSFSSDLSTWNVSQVTDMIGMFEWAESFSSNISTWDVSKVTDMTLMFANATSFSSDLSNWRVDSVTSMWGMFLGASKFQSDISSWNVSQVTTMDEMFYGASSFQQNLCPWESMLHSIRTYSDMFVGTNCLITDDPDYSRDVPSPFCHDCSST